MLEEKLKRKDPKKQGLKNTEISRRRLLEEKKSLRMMLTQQN